MKNVTAADWPHLIIAILVMVIFGAAMAVLVFVPIPDANKTMLESIMMALLLLVKEATGYWFSASQSSAKKDDTINSLAANAAPNGQAAISPTEPPAIAVPTVPRPTTIAAPLVAVLAIGVLLSLSLSACTTRPPGTAVTNPTTGAIEHVATQKQLAAATACRTFFGTADPVTGVVIERGASADAADLMRAGELKGAPATTVTVTALALQATCNDPNLLDALSDAQADADTAKLNQATAVIAAAKTGE